MSWRRQSRSAARAASSPRDPARHSLPAPTGHPQTPPKLPRCRAKTCSVAGACSQSWGRDSVQHSSCKSLLGDKEPRKRLKSATAAAQETAFPKRRERRCGETLREERSRRSSTPGNSSGVLQSGPLHPRAPLQHGDRFRDARSRYSARTAPLRWARRTAVPPSQHRERVPAPTPQLTCGRTLPATSPGHAQGSSSYHGCGKAYSSCPVTEQSLEDENTYPYAQLGMSSPHSRQKFCTEEKRFPDVPENAHDAASRSRAVLVLVKTQHAVCLATVPT